VLVGIGPEGWTPTQQPPFFSRSLLTTTKGTTATSAKKEDAETKLHKENAKETLSRPKTEGTAIAFGALFSLQCVRFITRGSLFIGDPWV
jgi:hypothetical protein